MDRLVEQACPFRRFEVEFDGMCTSPFGQRDKSGGWIDIAARSNRHEQISVHERVFDPLHVVGHFTEPHDIGPEFPL